MNKSTVSVFSVNPYQYSTQINERAQLL